MNGFEMLTGPLAQSIGWALVHLLWQGTAIAALLAAVLALMEKRSANARYIASCSALLLLLVCAVATAYRAYEPPLSPLAEAAVSFDTAPIETAAAPSATLPFATSNQPPATRNWLPALRTVLPTLRSALPTIVLVWLAGVIVLSLRLLASWLRTMRMARRDALDANAGWQRTVRRLAAGLKLRRAVRLVESAAVEVPTVIGWMRPVILLPLSSLSGLSSEQVEMVLAHELAHIRRHDFFVNLLQAVVETLLFYHPAVWWMSKRVRVERENCCDDLAVAVCGNALQYARTLTRLEELRAGDVQVAIAANGGSLIERIRRLVGTRSEGAVLTSRWIAGAGVLTLLVAVIAFPSMPLLAKAEPKPAPAAAPAPTPAATAARTQVEVHAEAEPAEAASDDDHDSAADDRDQNDAADDDSVDADDVDFDYMVPPVPPVPPVPGVEPFAPMAPMTPMTPVTPMTPMTPIAPMAPIAPGTPLTPMTPMTPIAPGTPLTPIAPMPPVAPMAPMPAIHFDGFDAPVIVDRKVLRMKVAEAMADERNAARRVRSHRPIGEGRLSVDDLITLSTVGVTPEYIGQMRAAFGSGLTLDDVVSMRVQGVSSEWLRSMKAAGVDIKTGRDAVSLAVQSVTPELVKALAAAGYTNLSAHDLVRLAVSGVNADYIREMSKFRSDKK